MAGPLPRDACTAPLTSPRERATAGTKQQATALRVTPGEQGGGPSVTIGEPATPLASPRQRATAGTEPQATALRVTPGEQGAALGDHRRAL
ncbi:hypothetical protein [Streptomyces sp. NPDC052721]|uniref:hypothetical protein n=1 Tax=Streptomyces sp. NPDC052721 TaxID=3154955 RepID=UPI00342039D1